jgi:hypothetical protein
MSGTHQKELRYVVDFTDFFKKTRLAISCQKTSFQHTSECLIRMTMLWKSWPTRQKILGGKHANAVPGPSGLSPGKRMFSFEGKI